MAKPSFVNLWANYPDHTVRHCSDGLDNECAIRMSIALNLEKTLTVSVGSYTEPKCSHGHARGAESLANWLYRKIGRPKIYDKPAEAKRLIAGKKGIIFFKDCFVRRNQTRRLGDHIDLWNAGLAISYDDPANEASQIWFWELT
ncbi:type VI secretion system amidase effector protein Tae4 [Bosea sp. (in: a-proteobacteria)]|uniref:type VI secretion system amidase effector protein Tae4 n=1 Tax=Bosea sp. (in: a-proteobacteria) TaxID=1871050 RepID=UPI002FC58983